MTGSGCAQTSPTLLCCMTSNCTRASNKAGDAQSRGHHGRRGGTFSSVFKAGNCLHAEWTPSLGAQMSYCLNRLGAHGCRAVASGSTLSPEQCSRQTSSSRSWFPRLGSFLGQTFLGCLPPLSEVMIWGTLKPDMIGN